ncbi:MAG: hypothetical protein CMP61_08470 [Flavobacteriales bacterium]|nr:hypothetical protein [Flavobacteriales bacterium]
MKIFMSILFSSFFIGLVAQNNQEINQSNSKGEKHGRWVKKHANGNIKYEGQFENGVPVGEFKRYNEKGKLISTLLYTDSGSKAAAHLYDMGKTMATGMYLNQKKDGLWKFYDKNEMLLLEEEYKEGVKDGVSKEYHSNGSLHVEQIYKNGTLTGVFKEYYVNGQLKIKKTFIDGNPDGIFMFFHDNGVPKVMGRYNRGIKNGTWKYKTRMNKVVKTEEYEGGNMTYTSEELITYWNDSLEIIRSREKYDKDGRSYFKAYHPNGKLHREGYFWKGAKDSTWNYYTFEGRLDTVRNFHHGKRQGAWTFKYPNGKVKVEEGWYLDRREGEYYEFYPNGKTRVKGNYTKGNKSGEWSFYDEQGQLIETKDFDKE